MNNLPLVSIIIPFYNRPEKTLKAIYSAQEQTYSRIEIIVVDDGSDQTIDAELFFLQPEISLVKHEQNKGANAARNTGLKHAHGSWIAFLDSDDTWHPTKIEKMLSHLLSQKKYGVAYCNFNKIKDGSIKDVFKVRKSGDLYSELLQENIVGTVSAPIIKKSILQEVNGFDENLHSAQDWDLWLRIAEKGKLFLAIDEALVNYNIPVSDQNISLSEEAFWKGRNAFLKKHKAKYKGKKSRALGQIYSNIGFLFLSRFRNRLKAFSCFILAIRSNPQRIKSWSGLVGCLLPAFILKKLLKD